jgi:hypothetical protein
MQPDAAEIRMVYRSKHVCCDTYKGEEWLRMGSFTLVEFADLPHQTGSCNRDSTWLEPANLGRLNSTSALEWLIILNRPGIAPALFHLYR